MEIDFFLESLEVGYRCVKLKILLVLMHFLMLWHILGIFIPKKWSVVNKLHDHEVNSEESDHNSESDIIKPYICPECDKKCEHLETFTDHFKK